MRHLLFIIFFLSSVNVFSQHDLTVKIPNIPFLKGHMQIGLYNNAKDFPKVGKEYKRFYFKVTNWKMTYTIKNLAKGKYAVAIFYDKNSDKVCNRNFLGIPTEKYGFSNDIKPVLSAPSFEDTKIVLDQDKTIQIKLQ